MTDLNELLKSMDHHLMDIEKAFSYFEGTTINMQPEGAFKLEAKLESARSSLSALCDISKAAHNVGRDISEHYSDCATHNEPAFEAGDCDCEPDSPSVETMVEAISDNGERDDVYKPFYDPKPTLTEEFEVQGNAAHTNGLDDATDTAY